MVVAWSGVHVGCVGLQSVLARCDLRKKQGETHLVGFVGVAPSAVSCEHVRKALVKIETAAS